MHKETAEEAYQRGRHEVFELFREEKLHPRHGYEREAWAQLIDDLISVMRSNMMEDSDQDG